MKIMPYENFNWNVLVHFELAKKKPTGITDWLIILLISEINYSFGTLNT
jgi:hypothetical protein